MIKFLSKLFAVAPLLLTPVLANASIVLSLSPVSQTASSVDIALRISGLGDAAAPSLSTFDVDVSFDHNHLGFSGAVFGDPDPVLGDQLDLFSLGENPLGAALTSPGTAVNVFEVSLDSPEDLDNFQADSFTLAILSFGILNPDTSGLSITVNTLGDADGNSLAASTTGATVTSVPLPGALVMMAPGLAGLAVAGKRKRNAA